MYIHCYNSSDYKPFLHILDTKLQARKNEEHILEIQLGSGYLSFGGMAKCQDG